MRAAINNALGEDHTLPAFVSSPLGAIAYGMAQRGYATARQKWRTHRTWTVSIEGGDDIFWDAQLWLMEQGAKQNSRALTISSHHDHNPFGPDPTTLRLAADDDEVQNVTIGGHPVAVSMIDPSGPLRTGPQQGSTYKPPKLSFSAKTVAGREAVIDLLVQLQGERTKERRQPGLNVLDKWGDWRRRSDLPPRPMESVITQGDVLGELHRDLKEFIDREKDYVRRAIPYHRAYLLEGPPGTGKTSAVKAVTNALGLDLWYAQLSGIDKDAKLSDVFGEVRARGVLLLEDIGSLPAAVDRTGEEAGSGDISTSGLLNALDGVATPHGLITIMTDNHPERLDPALLRPGRIDRIFHFAHPDRLTMFRHFQFFYEHTPQHAAEWTIGRSSAAISEIFKRNMDEPEAADYALCDEIGEDEERDWHTGAAGFLKRDELAGLLENHPPRPSH